MQCMDQQLSENEGQAVLASLECYYAGMLVQCSARIGNSEH